MSTASAGALKMAAIMADRFRQCREVYDVRLEGHEIRFRVSEPASSEDTGRPEKKQRGAGQQQEGKVPDIEDASLPSSACKTAAPTALSTIEGPQLPIEEARGGEYSQQIADDLGCSSTRQLGNMQSGPVDVTETAEGREFPRWLDESPEFMTPFRALHAKLDLILHVMNGRKGDEPSDAVNELIFGSFTRFRAEERSKLVDAAIQTDLDDFSPAAPGLPHVIPLVVPEHRQLELVGVCRSPAAVEARSRLEAGLRQLPRPFEPLLLSMVNNLVELELKPYREEQKRVHDRLQSYHEFSESCMDFTFKYGLLVHHLDRTRAALAILLKTPTHRYTAETLAAAAPEACLADTTFPPQSPLVPSSRDPLMEKNAPFLIRHLMRDRRRLLRRVTRLHDKNVGLLVELARCCGVAPPPIL